MKLNLRLVFAISATAFLACSDENSPTGPKDPSKDNPFKGKWSYHRYIEYANGGEDTVDLTEDFNGHSVIYFDSTGRYNNPSRPGSALDSLKYFFRSDSLFVTTYVENFLNYKGRPYVFRGENKDTLDFSDPDHIEIFIRAN